MIKELKNIKVCSGCSTTLTFDDKDVKTLNQGGWEEYVVKCPKCGKHIEVCYINGSWK
jgi:RNase P subunit RPR2